METAQRFIHLATPNPSSSDLQFSDMSALKNSRLSLDGGYESLLSTSASFFNSETSRLGCTRINEDSVDSYNSVVDETSNSASSVSSNSNPIFSQPTTPIKTASFKFNSATTPDFKQQYIADVNSFYFASIHRSSTKPIESIESPIKPRAQKSNFGDFSASNSPIKFVANSPKFVLNPGDYINQRDNLKSKLLRSPAFKLANSPHPYQQTKPVIRSFSSRLESNSGLLGSPTTRATPTEEEFMELLFKNKHLPKNPEFLIGRNMGVEFVDVVGELNKRSMNNVLDNVFKYLGKEDLVRVASVNKEWRACLKQNRKFNKKRVEFIKHKRNIYETTKENRDCDKHNVPYYELLNDSSLSHAELSINEKRERFRKRSSVSISGQHQSFVFAQIDPNCLSSSSMDVPDRASFSRPSLIGEIGRAGSSILDRMMSQRSFETEFRQISIADLDKENDVCKSKMSRKNSFSSSEKLASPKFIAKHLKLSPSKKQGSEVSHAKVDLIGSKKSKKNLKRL